jgi:hydroxymethylbilane synthase
MPNGDEREIWSLDTPGDAWPRVDEAAIWPRRGERERAARQPSRGAHIPAGTPALWIARAEGVPADFSADPSTIVWVAGGRTWDKLARRGIWVHGSADGLGDGDNPDVDTLAGRDLPWLRVTHTRANDPEALATYEVHRPWPDDLAGRSHFFWTSGSQFLEALDRDPALRTRRHASGPGRTSRVIRETLGPSTDRRIWLDYDQWIRDVIR